MNNKAKIRDAFLKTRSFLSKDYQEQVNTIIERKVNHYVKRYNLSSLAIFVSTKYEPETKNIIISALNSGIDVYLPKMDFAKQIMQFRKINNFDTDLVSNKTWNTLEPSEDCEILTDITKINTIFVPLVAFDQKLNRIGMGKGFYDRWFKDNNFVGYKIGLSQSTQLTNQMIDAEEFDVGLDSVITEKEIFVPFVEESEEFDYDVTYAVFNDETIIN